MMYDKKLIYKNNFYHVLFCTLHPIRLGYSELIHVMSSTLYIVFPFLTSIFKFLTLMLRDWMKNKTPKSYMYSLFIGFDVDINYPL